MEASRVREKYADNFSLIIKRYSLGTCGSTDPTKKKKLDLELPSIHNTFCRIKRKLEMVST